jgi:hypothetical protein
LELFLLLPLRELNRGKPFVSEGWNKVFVIKVGANMVEHKQVRPRGWGFRRAGMYRLKEVIIDDMELWTDVAGSEVANESNCASVQKRRTHVLSLPGSRFPRGNLAAILKSRLQDVYGTAPQGWALIRELKEDFEQDQISFGASRDERLGVSL